MKIRVSDPRPKGLQLIAFDDWAAVDVRILIFTGFFVNTWKNVELIVINIRKVTLTTSPPQE